MEPIQWRKWQRLFLLLFGVVGLILGGVLLRLSQPQFTGSALQPGETPVPVQPLPVAERIALIVSVASTVISALGFVSTTALAWRKEARESRNADLEEQRKQLELEKMRQELQPKPETPPDAGAQPR